MDDMVEGVIDGMSPEDLEKLWIKIWAEMFNIEVEPDETKETATVLQEFLRRVNGG